VHATWVANIVPSMAKDFAVATTVAPTIGSELRFHRGDESHWISASAEMTIATDAEPRNARAPRITQ